MNEPILEQSANGNLLLQTQTEMRHLKNTIIALREKFEALQFQNQENVQRAVSDSSGEISQLKQLVTALTPTDPGGTRTCDW